MHAQLIVASVTYMHVHLLQLVYIITVTNLRAMPKHHSPAYCYTNLWCLQVTNLLKELEFIFVPFVNPDGYEVYKYSLLLYTNLYCSVLNQ